MTAALSFSHVTRTEKGVSAPLLNDITFEAAEGTDGLGGRGRRRQDDAYADRRRDSRTAVGDGLGVG